MVNWYYQRELSHLRDLAVEFSKAHPALAPMLSGPSQDPDVERLLEGTAFLTGMLRQKLDDEFPEVIHGLMRLIFPHYLRPIPSSTIMAFTPKPSLMEKIRVPAESMLDSKPVDGTRCRFRTCFDVDVYPLELKDASFSAKSGRPAAIVLSFGTKNLPLNQLRLDSLRLHLSGAYPEAAGLYQTMMTRVRRVVVSSPAGGTPAYLRPGAIRPVGFAYDESLLPYPRHSFPGYRILQEYFILPEKFLFIDVGGLSVWTDRGPGGDFQIAFELEEPPTAPPTVKKDQFTLFATPAVNIFPHEADPINLDHRQPEYRVIPSGGRPDHYQVYQIRKVTGFAAGTVQRREFMPFEMFRPGTEGAPVYYVNQKTSAIRSLPDVYLSVSYPVNNTPLAPETLSLELSCTNAYLPENLKYGDIREATGTSPELCTFSNIKAPTSVQQPPLGQNLLWRFLSHLSLNLLTLAHTDSLKALLKLYIFADGRDRASVTANEKRVEGVEGIEARPTDRLVYGQVRRGQEIRLILNPTNFAGPGDMYLFGSVMDFFLGTYAGINSFSHLTVQDALKGETYQWPPRTGDRPLM